jgi:hypothetical protein
MTLLVVMGPKYLFNANALFCNYILEMHDSEDFFFTFNYTVIDCEKARSRFKLRINPAEMYSIQYIIKHLEQKMRQNFSDAVLYCMNNKVSSLKAWSTKVLESPRISQLFHSSGPWTN